MEEVADMCRIGVFLVESGGAKRKNTPKDVELKNFLSEVRGT